jgi:tRNA-modifying protein YgfZ
MTETCSALHDLAVIRFEGVDAPRFLQGYLTCDTQLLSADHWGPGAICNLQGRVVANGWFRIAQHGAPQGLDALVHAGLANRVLEFLHNYLRFSKTRARVDSDCTVDATIRHTAPDSLEFELRPAQAPVTPFREFAEQLNQLRLVLVTPPVSEQFLPQALGLVNAGAVSFDKGCYLGQEIVARAQHRGIVKRTLMLFRSHAQLTASSMDPLTDANERKVGTVVQVGTTSALVVVNSDIKSDTLCYLGETQVTPVAD